ncbi:alkaline phosphatase D family protein [Aquimarina agarilytica]|uniref:alkaline phosphatase D family protein n=1 Tax=Aquimarina agarilytica TaxID=1087449 RepID=UPI00028966D6|nr:alkaline phosphatase D family protein [Aquimarina agarilytica]
MMRFYFSFVVLLFIASTKINSQQVNYQRSTLKSTTTEQALSFNPLLKPFYHGVASGDPLEDRVIIWTRVTPEIDEAIEVTWKIATDTNFSNIVNSGSITTNAEKDYTVKVDVTGLSAATTYYYAFKALGTESIIGRTRTTPSSTDTLDHLRFAVVSCSNYQAGYFNPYKKIGERKDLDAVIHLGDYIYEYGAGEGTYGYDESRKDRANIPDTEILNLADYRMRYSLYRLDKDLLAAHQQHPFIAIWDDHESANDSYTDGAENHNEEGKDEGDWETRKSISKQVYFEWMPIRDEANFKINRTIQYGKLADIITIDTRLEGRDKQIFDVTDAALYATDRTLLGTPQRNWMFGKLNNSEAKWKIIANQVIFSEFNVGWAAQAPQTAEELESIFLDIWDGYPAERDLIIDYITDNNIDNTVILTGDFHSTFAFDVAKRPSVFSQGAPTSINYNPATGAGSVAVEFATPSITSANFDENIGVTAAAGIEFQINTPLPIPALGNPNPNPHLKYNDLDQHGYMILDLTNKSVQADWFFTDIFDPTSTSETTGESWYSNASENRLQKATSISQNKIVQPELAPAIPINTLNTDSINKHDNIVIFELYPNPLNINKEELSLQFGLTTPNELTISITGFDGKFIKELYKNYTSAGMFKNSFKLNFLAPDIYFMVFEVGGFTTTKKVLVK